MKNFNFHNPTRILFGKGSIAELKDQVPADAKVLILYGGGSAERTGVLDQVREALAGRAILEFGGIEPNPRYATTLKAVEMIRENAVTFLLAVGGGSVIDATKFIAAAVKYDGDAWDILTSRGSVITQAVPFGSVLTLPATGSEMNSGGVITNPEKEAKLPFSSLYCYPVFSVLNGLIGAGVPQDWATHMIGHEITALNDTDHARTLAVVLPSLIDDQREAKREKLLQYASNVWNIREGSDDERIDAVIEATRGFFEQMGIKTRLGDYDVDADGINHIVSALKEHGMTALGEHNAIGPDEARRILEAAL